MGIQAARLLLPFLFIFADPVSAAPANPKPRCQDLVENFCDEVWSPAHRGNWDFRQGRVAYPIRLGQTPNDISQARFAFLTALSSHYADLPPDIHSALDRTGFRPLLDAYIHRQAPATLTLRDLARPEFLRGVLAELEEAMSLVSWERNEKQHPGSVNRMADETSLEVERDEEKNLDRVWSELFVAVWKDDPSWRTVEEDFRLVRAEYRAWIGESKLYSPVLKKELLADLDSLKLVLPGENPAKSNAKKWHECGIDLNNSFYSPVDHELTVCVGDFYGTSPLLAIAHEVGHSFSLTRRLLDYWSRSDYGHDVLGLWNRTCDGRHFSCAEWAGMKKKLGAESEALPPYHYEDAASLEKFVDKELGPVPKGEELRRLAERMAKGSLRSEVNARYLEGLIKPEEILPTGGRVPNFMYLKPCLNANRWPQPASAFDEPELQLELFFTEEYACQLEHKTPPAQALRRSVEEAEKLSTRAWAALLRVPGRFSYLQDARDEEFAQDIEEDVVDANSAAIAARILERKDGLEERRGEFLASMAGYCEKPSFLQRYPEEALVLSRFSNLSHSEGLERRKKLLTPEMKAVLGCR